MLESFPVIRKLDCSMSTRGGRTRAATATFLSSLFPGVGQLYNCDWIKAGVMITLTLVLLVAVKAALESVLAAAGAVVLGAFEVSDLEDSTAWAELLPALAHPSVQSCARWSLLPPVIALCAVVLWSMTDAYRRVRSEADGRAATGRGASSRPT